MFSTPFTNVFLALMMILTLLPVLPVLITAVPNKVVRVGVVVYFIFYYYCSNKHWQHKAVRGGVVV